MSKAANVVFSRHVDFSERRKLVVVRDSNSNIHAMVANPKTGKTSARWRWTLIAGEWRRVGSNGQVPEEIYCVVREAMAHG